MHCYELPLGTYGSGDSSLGSNSAEEHDAWYAVRKYKEMMRKDELEFGDQIASFRKKTKLEPKLTAHVAAIKV